jgi:hypothetical protein
MGVGTTGGVQDRARRIMTADRNRFLDALSQTGNVQAAAAMTGLCLTRLYGVRRSNPRFAAAWVAALTTGYEAIEAKVVSYVLACDDGAGLAGGAKGAGGTPQMPGWVQAAFALLSRQQAGGERERAGSTARRKVTAADTDAALIKQLDMLHKVRARAGIRA